GNTASTSGPQMTAIYDNYDPNFYHCNIEGGIAGIDWNFGAFTGLNVSGQDTVPHFKQPASGSGSSNDTLQLAIWVQDNGSTMTDSGTVDTTGLNLPPKDLNGRDRIVNLNIDIGAYEKPVPFSFT